MEVNEYFDLKYSRVKKHFVEGTPSWVLGAELAMWYLGDGHVPLEESDTVQDMLPNMFTALVMERRKAEKVLKATTQAVLETYGEALDQLG